MKLFGRYLLLAFIFATPLVSHAENSMLRVMCDGDDVGAEVSVNGKFKGECPVDMQVAPGKLKLRVVKNIDDLHVGWFEQEIRMGDGIVKKVEVVLENRLNAEGRRQEAILAPAREDAQWKSAIEAGTQTAMQAYLEKYPQGRYAAQARMKNKEYGQISLRSKIPFKLPDDVWRTLEASEVYNNSLRVHSSSFSLNHDVIIDSGSYTSSPSKDNYLTYIQQFPLDDHFSVLKNKTSTSGNSVEYSSYYCGFILLGAKHGDGTEFFKTNRIDELQGSLFPLRIGNKMSYRIQSTSNMTSSFSYEIVGQMHASELDARLTGIVWKIKTQINYISDTYSKSYAGDDYYLEDLGIMLSNIGAYVEEKMSWVLPSPGFRNISKVNDSKVTTIYNRFDWTIDK